MEINDILSQIITAPTKASGKLIVVYATQGAGKTSTFCQATDALLIECKDYSSDSLKETGLIRSDFPVIKTTGWSQANDIIRGLAEGDHKFKNVIIDGGSGLSDWLDADVLQADFDGDAIKFAAFGRGAAVVGIRWQELAESIIALRQSGVWVFVLCHKATITEKNASGNDYMKSSLALSKEKIAPLTRYVDAILFIDTVIGEVSLNKMSGVAKVTGGVKRIMYTELSAAYDAKNRLGLPPEIDLGGSPQEGFEAFKNAVKAGRKKKKEEKKDGIA